MTSGAENRGDSRLRRLDRSLGVPVVKMIAALRRRRARPKIVGSIGFLLLGAIGDTLLASAAIGALRREFPQAHFVWFVSASNRAFAEILAGADSVVVLPLNAPWRAIPHLRARTFDVMIDFGPWPRISAIFAGLARARFTIGFDTAGQARHFAFDAAVVHASDRHEMENFHALAAPLLGHATGGRPLLSRPPGASALPPGRRWIVFHPWPAGFQSQCREWPQTRWLELAATVSGWGYGIAITGGPADAAASRGLAEKTGALSLAGMSLSQTLQVLADAAAIVSVNTGVMHLAAALDRPLVALHGPTNVKRWGPLSDKAVSLGPGPERGCAYLDLGFEYPENPPDCMGMIAVDDVARALREQFAGESLVSPDGVEPSAL